MAKKKKKEKYSKAELLEMWRAQMTDDEGREPEPLPDTATLRLIWAAYNFGFMSANYLSSVVSPSNMMRRKIELLCEIGRGELTLIGTPEEAAADIRAELAISKFKAVADRSNEISAERLRPLLRLGRQDERIAAQRMYAAILGL